MAFCIPAEKIDLVNRIKIMSFKTFAFILIVLTLIAVALSSSVQGALMNSYTTGADGDGFGNEETGQGIGYSIPITSNYTIGNISFPLKNSGGALSGTINLSVRNSAGSVLGWSVINASVITSSYTDVYFVFSSPFAVTTGTYNLTLFRSTYEANYISNTYENAGGVYNQYKYNSAFTPSLRTAGRVTKYYIYSYEGAPVPPEGTIRLNNLYNSSLINNFNATFTAPSFSHTISGILIVPLFVAIV